MVVTTQKVNVVIEYIQKNFNKFNQAARKNNEMLTKQQRAFTDASKTGKRHIETTQRNTVANSGFSKVMSMNQEEFGRFNKQGYRFTKIGGRLANRFRMMTHGARGFRMEMLGVLFFGMAMQRAFSGLIKTSLEWLGVWDVINVALGILFLPLAEQILGWALKFLNWVGTLTEKQKEWYGKLVLLGLILGTIIMLVGVFALGIGSLIMAFSWLFTPMGAILGIIAAIAGYIGFKAFFSDSASKVDKLRESMMAFGVSGEVFDKVKNKVIDFSNTLKSKLMGDEEVGEIGIIQKIKNAFTSEMAGEEYKTMGTFIMEKLVGGTKQFFTDNPMVLIGAIVGGLAAGPLGVAIGAAMGLGLGKIDFEKIDETIQKGLEIMDGVLIGLEKSMPKIMEFLEKFLGAIGEWVGENIDKIFKLGWNLGKSLIKGLIEGALSLGGKLGQKLMELMGYEEAGARGYAGLKGALERKQMGGYIPTTKPYLLHAGEYVVPKNEVGKRREIVLNITYNTNVSDKDELERMFSDNNYKLAEEVKRLINI